MAWVLYFQNSHITESVPILKPFYHVMCLGKTIGNRAFHMMEVQCSCNVDVGKAAFLGKKMGFTLKPSIQIPTLPLNCLYDHWQIS